MSKAKTAALYLRVSRDGQTVENQRQALMAVTERRGWRVVAEFVDEGISGSKGRDKRPGLDALLQAASRGKFDVVMAWAIDRVGRSLVDLLATIQHLEAWRVDLYLDQQNIDTTTPTGKLMFQICGAFAEFERTMIIGRTHAGLDRARAAGKRLGRPKIDARTEEAIRQALARGDTGMLKIGRQIGVSGATVQRVKREMTGTA